MIGSSITQPQRVIGMYVLYVGQKNYVIIYTVNTNTMTIDIVNITPVQGIALVKLYKPRYKKEKQTVLDDEKNKGKDPKKDIMALKTVEEKVMLNIQTIEIVAIDNTNTNKFEVGDIVLIDWRKVKDFDLYKDVKSINVYDILGKVNMVS